MAKTMIFPNPLINDSLSLTHLLRRIHQHINYVFPLQWVNIVWKTRFCKYIQYKLLWLEDMLTKMHSLCWWKTYSRQQNPYMSRLCGKNHSCFVFIWKHFLQYDWLTFECICAGDTRGWRRYVFSLFVRHTHSREHNISGNAMREFLQILARTFTCTQGWTHLILVVKGESHCDLTSHLIAIYQERPAVIFITSGTSSSVDTRMDWWDVHGYCNLTKHFFLPSLKN